MRATGLAGWWLGLVLVGCTDTPVFAQEPALLAANAANASILKAAVERALGVPVELAADALTKQSLLVIEPKPAMINGQRIQGRETRRPEQFTLLLVKGECVLRRDSSGELLSLTGASCRRNAAGH